MEDIGQKTKVWSDKWKQLSPESDIRMWDYYGLRQWILKYTPRYGKVLEAGCGLGRYNFYLSRLGIEIIGLDFSEETIEFLNDWKGKHGYDNEFVVGDVKKLGFNDNSLCGYLSFGVVEHFIEGPHKPISEAYRVLQSGGIAIISTPSPSWSKFYQGMSICIKETVMRMMGKRVFEMLFPKKKFSPKIRKVFFQHEYSAKQLKRFAENQGFYISRYSGADVLYTFTEFGNHSSKYIKTGSFGNKISHWFENSNIPFLGAQSIIIAIKKSDNMHCFLCGENSAIEESLNKYDVPLCKECSSDSNSIYYLKGSSIIFHNEYKISPPFQPVEEKECFFCKVKYKTDILFEDLGFDKNVCPDCIKSKNINILLSNTSLQPIWRKKATI
jgi:ubiquinone/menaquinone biosynthesis C-methylase UbiE